MKDIRGFSLIEVLTVVIIASILLTMVVPMVRPALERGKVNSAASVLAADLQYAQVMAVRNRRPVAIIVDTGLRQYLIRDRDDPTNVYRSRTLGAESEYDLDAMSASPTSNEIYPNGISSSTMTLVIGLNGYTRQVSMTRAGQVRIAQ